MAEQMLELEGTWEEIVGWADQLAGRRVRLVVLPEHGENPAAEGSPGPGQLAMLQLLDEWRQTPLTAEEHEILNGFEEFRKQHPFQLRQLEDRS